MRRIERQIYYYEVVLEKYDKEKNSFPISNDYKNDLKDLFLKFEKLPFDKKNIDFSRYLKKNNGTYDFVKIDNITDKYIEGKIINSDDSGLTYYEINGEVKFIKDKLQDSASIAEIAHFVIYLDTKIMCFEYNAKASHSPSLSNYINEKSEGNYRISLKNLQSKNKEEKIKALEKLKKVRFSTSGKLLDLKNARENKIISALSSTLSSLKTVTYEDYKISIEIQPINSRKKGLSFLDAKEIKETLNKVKEAAMKNSENKLEEESYFEFDVEGFNDLNEQIVVNYTRDFIKSKITLDPTQITSEKFYEKINEGYNKIYKKYIG